MGPTRPSSAMFGYPPINIHGTLPPVPLPRLQAPPRPRQRPQPDPDSSDSELQDKDRADLIPQSSGFHVPRPKSRSSLAVSVRLTAVSRVITRARNGRMNKLRNIKRRDEWRNQLSRTVGNLACCWLGSLSPQEIDIPITELNSVITSGKKKSSLTVRDCFLLFSYTEFSINHRHDTEQEQRERERERERERRGGAKRN
jgi:hypothetical protein